MRVQFHAHYASETHLQEAWRVLALLRLFVDIALMRRGPESAPGTPAALAVTAGLYVLVAVGVLTLLRAPEANWPAQLAVGLLFTLAWYWILLRFGGKPERFIQTMVAILGYQAMLLPVSLAVQVWFVDTARSGASVLVPGALAMVLLAWALAVHTRIVRLALEWRAALAGVVVLAEFFSSFVLLAALFPVKPNP